MLVLISYDVNTEDAAGRRRLRRIAKQCLNYGQRVQNSVFECSLDAAQLRALEAKLVEPLYGKGPPLRRKTRVRPCRTTDFVTSVRSQSAHASPGTFAPGFGAKTNALSTSAGAG